MNERPEDIAKKWEERLTRFPTGHTRQMLTEMIQDLRGLIERNKTGFWDLPPLPDHPAARIVIDCPEGQLAHKTIIRAGVEGDRVTLEGKFVRALFKTPPERIPERTERALHWALGCCDKHTDECDGKAVAEAWRNSK